MPVLTKSYHVDRSRKRDALRQLWGAVAHLGRTVPSGPALCLSSINGPGQVEHFHRLHLDPTHLFIVERKRAVAKRIDEEIAPDMVRYMPSCGGYTLFRTNLNRCLPKLPPNIVAYLCDTDGHIHTGNGYGRHLLESIARSESDTIYFEITQPQFSAGGGNRPYVDAALTDFLCTMGSFASVQSYRIDYNRKGNKGYSMMTVSGVVDKTSRGASLFNLSTGNLFDLDIEAEHRTSEFLDALEDSFTQTRLFV